MPSVAPSQPAPGSGEAPEVVIIGAGPAGLTAAFCLHKHGVASTILEADDVVGGISRTAERDGWRFDIGGHRFFTKVAEVEALWHEILPDEDFLLRPRKSRIYYRGKFIDYPLKAGNALRKVGLIEAIRCVLSYIWVRIHPPKDQSNFEGWVAARFGWRLYRMLFKTYTEKLWGVDADQIQADWAAQRIKNLSLAKAVINALPGRGKTDVTSLIEEFQYPKYGPGMMWEVCRDKVQAAGSTVHMRTPVTRILRDDNGAIEVQATDPDGRPLSLPCSHVISSMPISELVQIMDPPVPPEVERAANELSYRDFITVALVVPQADVPWTDNWIYVHDPSVGVGRIQNFGSWSPYLVKEGRNVLGLEYFVFEGDGMWTMADEDLVELAKNELGTLGLVEPERVETGYVVRMPKAYPTYDETYRANVDVLREWLAEHTPNVHPVGRNGMFRYNNQDHSMFTALLTVENICKGTTHDIWAVNVEEEYHEEAEGVGPEDAGLEDRKGTGRDAPVIPRSAVAARRRSPSGPG